MHTIAAELFQQCFCLVHCIHMAVRVCGRCRRGNLRDVTVGVSNTIMMAIQRARPQLLLMLLHQPQLIGQFVERILLLRRQIISFLQVLQQLQLMLIKIERWLCVAIDFGHTEILVVVLVPFGWYGAMILVRRRGLNIREGERLDLD